MICPKNYIEKTPEMLEKASIYPILYADSQRHCYICHRKIFI